MGEEEVMKYLDWIDLGAFGEDLSISMACLTCYVGICCIAELDASQKQAVQAPTRRCQTAHIGLLPTPQANQSV